MIDYANLVHAQELYRVKGFQSIEVPWSVSEDIARVTYDWGSLRHPFQRDNGEVLVGSAEQGFIQLRRLGYLKKNQRYQSISPCFRDEPHVDEFHQKWFMKLELYVPWHDEVTFNDTITDVCSVMGRVGGINPDEFLIAPTSEGVDIELDGIEVGSYGMRWDHGWPWIYATGLAEPRFSTAIKRHKTKKG